VTRRSFATTARLTWRQHRFELAMLVILAAIIIAIEVATAAIEDWFVGHRCSAESRPAECLGLDWLHQGLADASSTAVALASFVPPVIGLVVGVKLVGAEVERGTAALPWTVGTSRTRWLLVRVFLLAGFIALISGAAGLSVDAVTASRDPGVDLADSLGEYQLRGWLLPARAVAMFGVAVLIGAVMGRTLPALLVTLLISGIGFYAIVNGFEMLHRTEGVPLQMLLAPTSRDLYVDGRLRDRATSAYVTWEEAYSVEPGDGAEFAARFEFVPFGIPGSQSRLVVGRMVGVHLLVFVACTGLAALVVRRRRPS
jgi:hypothetical protein